MALDFNAAATDFFTALLKKPSSSNWEQLFSSGHQKRESIVLDWEKFYVPSFDD